VNEHDIAAQHSDPGSLSREAITLATKQLHHYKMPNVQHALIYIFVIIIYTHPACMHPCAKEHLAARHPLKIMTWNS